MQYVCVTTTAVIYSKYKSTVIVLSKLEYKSAFMKN